jgi:ferredoxin--NADP+ reductase
LSPTAVLADDRGRVRGLRLEKNELVADAQGRVQARGTGVYEDLDVGWVFVSIGYEGRPLPGVPFDHQRGTIANVDGRVVDPETGEAEPGQYCVGWARSGARGLIASHKVASAEVVGRMLNDAAASGEPPHQPRGREALRTLLEERGVRFVTFEDWRHIDAAEVERGTSRGAPRVKFSEVDQMVALVEMQRRGW